MEQLPLELSCKIFSLLDYRHLVTAGLVCRSWKFLTCNCDLWQNLYTRRWGQEQNEGLTFDRKSWKAVYEYRDRCDRIGLKMTITREGSSYLLVNQGEVLRFLGSVTKKELQQESLPSGVSGSISEDQARRSTGTQSDNADTERRCLVQEADAEGCGRTQRNEPCLGLIDRLFFFVGDLEHAMQRAKRYKIR